jgi:hypothetical protein
MAITYQIVAGDLPEGAILISDGTLAGALSFDMPDSPAWVTVPDSVTIDEGDSYSRTFVANPNAGSSSPINRYVIQAGNVPWGLSFNSSTGTLNGTIADLIVPIDVDSKDPVPTWNTTAGTLGTFNEFKTISTITLSATANLGTSIEKYFLVSGYLPWGLHLEAATGQITGTVNELVPTIATFEPASPAPTWNTTAGSLGSVDEGSVFDTTLSASASAGNTLGNYHIVDGYLPWGLVLTSTTGQITGTAEDVDSTTVYTFTVRVFDTGTGFADRIFSITVNNL